MTKIQPRSFEMLESKGVRRYCLAPAGPCSFWLDSRHVALEPFTLRKAPNVMQRYRAVEPSQTLLKPRGVLPLTCTGFALGPAALPFFKR